MLWNQWPNATGIGGRMFMESAAEWDRNMHYHRTDLFRLAGIHFLSILDKKFRNFKGPKFIF